MKLKSKISFENKLFRLALIASLPPAILLLIALYYFDISRYALTLIGIFIFTIIAYCLYAIREQTQFQLRTVSNLMEAMISGDYSMRGRRASYDDVLGELVALINDLSDALTRQRLETKETQLLLTKVINQIDVAILAVDASSTLTLVNPAAARLLGKEFSSLSGSTLDALGLEGLLQTDKKCLISIPIVDGYKKFYVYNDEFLEDGQRHRLIFITDIQRILREEERRAWQNLLRVLSHEINNSLSPISSISDTLAKQIDDSEVHGELFQGLSVIKKRADSLKAFIQSYQTLTKLPEPQKTVVNLKASLENIIPLFAQCRIELLGDPSATLYVDAEQFEHLFLNLLKNANEAMSDDKLVVIEWHIGYQYVQISLKDSGCGISNFDNIFTPFYTTKEHGSGIGLVLSRQIVANHDGELYIQNRKDRSGVEVTVRFPKVSYE